MTTLMSEHPKPSHDAALAAPVQGPEKVFGPGGQNRMRDPRGQVEQCADDCEVTEKVHQRGSEAPLEAVVRNSVADGLQGELGRLDTEIRWSVLQDTVCVWVLQCR